MFFQEIISSLIICFSNSSSPCGALTHFISFLPFKDFLVSNAQARFFLKGGYLMNYDCFHHLIQICSELKNFILKKIYIGRIDKAKLSFYRRKENERRQQNK